MLTDPVTNLNISFTSQAISRKEEAFQLALCLRDEVEDHEVATFFSSESMNQLFVMECLSKLPKKMRVETCCRRIPYE